MDDEQLCDFNVIHSFNTIYHLVIDFLVHVAIKLINELFDDGNDYHKVSADIIIITNQNPIHIMDID